MVFFQNASLHEELLEIIQSDTLEACMLPTLMSATTNTRGRRDALQTNSCTYIQTDFRQGAIFRGVHRRASSSRFASPRFASPRVNRVHPAQVDDYVHVFVISKTIHISTTLFISSFVSLLVIARVIVRPLHESTSALCLSNSSG